MTRRGQPQGKCLPAALGRVPLTVTAAAGRSILKIATLAILSNISTTVAMKCTQGDTLAKEKAERSQRIAKDAERRALLEQEKTCKDKLLPCLMKPVEARSLLREGDTSASNKWASGNPTPHLQLTVIPTPDSTHRLNHKLTHDDLHQFDQTIELLLNIKCTAAGQEGKIETKIDSCKIVILSRFACCPSR